jgi:hypothetical protein
MLENKLEKKATF